ncbi:YoaK family protein [Gemmatimonas sp.]
MPIEYARFLIGRQRSYRADRQLGWSLAAVAGAINAGGFLAVGQYTSHVTGAVSSFTDNFVLGETKVALTAVAAVLAFMAGAMTCAIMVNFARRRDLTSEYALPLLLEAALILTFGLAGSQLSSYRGLLLPLTVALLSFLMGLQNAMVTKLSERVIRTTHMTGIVTDLGIELGKLIYWNRTASNSPVLADRERLRVLGGLLLSFTLGGLIGASGFKHVGYGFSIPIALFLAALALVPAVDDARRFAAKR